MKKHLPLTFLLFVLSANLLSAQNTFQKTYGSAGVNWPFDVQVTSDSGYIIAGYTTGFGAGEDDGYVVKTNHNGDTLWTMTYGDTAQERISSIKQTADSGYIFTGYTTSYGAGGSDVYLVKIDKNGNMQWQKTFGGAGNDGGSEVRLTSGGYIVVGYNNSLGTDSDRVNGVYIIKTDANGDCLWSNVYAGLNYTNVNSGNSIYLTNDSGYIIAGSGFQIDSTNSDVYLLKIADNGNFLWDEYIGGTGNDAAASIQQTTDHGFIITGTTNSFGAGSNDAYLVKTDSAGTLTWSKTFGGFSEDEGAYGQQTSDGGYFIIGETGSSGQTIKGFYFVKTNANGDSLWTKVYAKSDTDIDLGSSGKQTADGGYILAGVHAVFHGSGTAFYLIKTDSSGNSSPVELNIATIETSPSSHSIRKLSDGMVSSLCLTTGVKETAIADNKITLYPNPVDKELIISIAQGIINHVEIYNVVGEQLKTETGMPGKQESIDVSSLSAGIYFVRIINETGMWTAKFIKE